MSEDVRRARDLDLLDAIDALPREVFSEPVWRVARQGRDPVLGSSSRSRWCAGSFDVLYTSLERDGAIAEVHALLSLQPVFPSRGQWFVHKLDVKANQTLRLVNSAALNRFGIDTARYADRNYDRTQEIADAAYFLGFDGLIGPSARWKCLNAVLFTDRLAPDQIEVRETGSDALDWDDWRKHKLRA